MSEARAAGASTPAAVPSRPVPGVDEDVTAEAVAPAEGYRARTAKGVLVLSSFRIGLAALNLLRNLALAAFLTQSEYGLWGLILTTLITLGLIKDVGIADKYVQQRAPDQTTAFQRAFTLNLAYSGLFYLLALAAVPVYALLIYDRPEVLAPALVLSASLLISALHAPIWPYYRRMEYRKQLSLEAIEPVLATVVMIVLLALGMGVWGLVAGAVAGTTATAIAAIWFSPYPLRLRYDRGTLREYVDFSWPVLYAGLTGMLVVQGALIVGNAALGLAAVGLIGLAGNFARFGNRVEILLRRTLYPAVAAVQDRREVLLETFEKSNRLGLMWAIPFGAAMALFAGDLVHYVLGERWREAVPLLRLFGPIIAAGTIGFAWTTFYQAIGRTRPLAVAGTATFIGFFALVVPSMIIVGVLGYGYGLAALTLVQLTVRGIYLQRLFPGFHFLRHSLRSVAPVLPAVALTLGLRLLLDGGERGGLEVAAELGVFVASYAAATWALERSLITEAVGYLRRAFRGGPKVQGAPA